MIKALAQRELARYFRTRTSVGWKTQAEAIPHLSPQSRAVADGAVEGSLQGGLVPLVYSFPNGKIDWHFNATDHTPGEAHNDEWQWQLNRMSFWSDLAVAYRATGDERYAEAFVQELRSWIVQCPVPDQHRQWSRIVMENDRGRDSLRRLLDRRLLCLSRFPGNER